MESLHIDDVKALAMSAHGDARARRSLFADALEGEGRASTNALWALTHLPSQDDVFIAEHRQGLTALALEAADATRRRLALTLLERLEWGVDQVDTALLDFCLGHLMDSSEAVGVRALCAKLAYLQCRHYPELLGELRQSLLMLDPALLKPGLKHIRNKILEGSGERLFSLRDEKYAAFQRPLLPNLAPESIIGVRTPALRLLAKELRGSAEAEAFLAALPHRYFEENQLHAFLVAQERDYRRCIERLDCFLPFVDNWATCDQLSPRVLGRHRAELLPEVRRWMASGHEYTCRFGIGMLMRYFLEPDTFSEEYLQWVAAVDREEYYVRMMQAWFFATALAKQWSAAEPYMHDGRLPDWVRRKAIQKALESFRIPAAHKSHLRSLK
jgi:3-methyladenine DNA glycosylase AlkD